MHVVAPMCSPPLLGYLIFPTSFARTCQRAGCRPTSNRLIYSARLLESLTWLQVDACRQAHGQLPSTPPYCPTRHHGNASRQA